MIEDQPQDVLTDDEITTVMAGGGSVVGRLPAGHGRDRHE